MASVLIIDDDFGTRETCGRALRYLGFDVTTADSVASGIALAVRVQPDVAVVDICLPDGSGMEVVSSIQRACPSTSVVVMTGFATTRSVVDAMRLGVRDYLEKPVDIDDLAASIGALAHTTETPLRGRGTSASHASARWADFILPVIESPRDLRTLSQWGHWVGASPGAIRNWCHTANVSSRDSLNFARLLRAVVRHVRESSPAQELLDVTDRRTLFKLLRLGDVARPARLPLTIDEFLREQRWIRSESAVAEIRRRLEHYPLSSPHEDVA